MEGRSNTKPVERRRFPRYPCTGGAEIFQSGRRWGWAAVNEISCGGCYIETLHPLPVGAEVPLRLTIADISLDVCAKVTSADPMVGTGMIFGTVPPKQWNNLTQIIE
jgi:hypothetical protein